jgi:hypothetical protein
LSSSPNRAALVVSLDFELHWGVRDHSSDTGPYRANLLGARKAIPKLLQLFEEFEIAATWATVGFLFATSREELQALSPTSKPEYADPRLFPYEQEIGRDEQEDPLHYAPSLIELIRHRTGQEIATHTFSHYYCLEDGSSPDSFDADLSSAVRIAANRGIELRSIVFPRNQHNPLYDDILLANGITSFRGNPPRWFDRKRPQKPNSPASRLGRAFNTYLKAPNQTGVSWETLIPTNGLSNVPATMFLRPYSPRLAVFEPLRLARINRLLWDAARARHLIHLWWHPHNFGIHQDENVDFLRRCLQMFAAYRDRREFESLNMLQAATILRNLAS